MSKGPSEGDGRRRRALLAGAIALVAVVTTAAGLLWWRPWAGRQGGETIPERVDTGGGEVVGGGEVIVEVGGVPGGEVPGGGGDGRLLVRLSEGQAQPQEVEPVPVVQGEPLTGEEIEQV